MNIIATVFVWLLGMCSMGAMLLGTGVDVASTIGAIFILNVFALAVIAFSK